MKNTISDHFSSSSSAGENESIVNLQAEDIMQALESQLYRNCSWYVIAENLSILSVLFGGIVDSWNHLRIVKSSKQGRRRFQEGLVLTKTHEELKHSIFAVYDGHCGRACATQSWDIFAAEFEKGSFLFGNYTESKLKQVFLCIDHKICTSLRAAHNRSGSTALIALVHMKKQRAYFYSL